MKDLIEEVKAKVEEVYAALEQVSSIETAQGLVHGLGV